MIEQGRVSEILNNGLARVEFEPNAACAKCKAGCHLIAGGKMTVEANNEAGAKVGERVEVLIPEKQVISSAFLVYLFPLICLIIGYFVGSYLSRVYNIWVNSELLGIFFAFLGMGLAFLVVGTYDRFITKNGRGRGKIIQVIT